MLIVIGLRGVVSSLADHRTCGHYLYPSALSDFLEQVPLEFIKYILPGHIQLLDHPADSL